MSRSVNLCRCALPSAVLRSSTGIRVDNGVCRHPWLHEYDLYFTLPDGMCTETSGFRIQGISISNNKKANKFPRNVCVSTYRDRQRTSTAGRRQTDRNLFSFLIFLLFVLAGIVISNFLDRPYSIFFITKKTKRLDLNRKGLTCIFGITPFLPLFTCFI